MNSPADRRQLDRRLTDLERRFALVEQDLAHIKEQMRSNFTSLDNGQRLLAEKMDGLSGRIGSGLTDIDATVVGRALQKDLDGLREKYDMHHKRFASQQGDIEDLKSDRDKATGALVFANALATLGAASGILALVVLIAKALLR